MAFITGPERVPATAPSILLDPDDFLTFRDVARGLPNLRPRATQGWLRDLWGEALIAEQPDTSVAGQTVSVDELSELFHETFRTGFPSQVVSPRGAQLLLRLYAAGALDTGKKQPDAPSPELVAYAQSEPELREKAAAHKEVRQRAQAAREKRLAHPERIAEAEFSYSLLNALFFKHVGKGGGTLRVGGIEVHKNISQYTSNSGKSQDWRVRFTWQSADGCHRELRKTSAFEGNRRNDPNRNWGLGPE